MRNLYNAWELKEDDDDEKKDKIFGISARCASSLSLKIISCVIISVTIRSLIR